MNLNLNRDISTTVALTIIVILVLALGFVMLRTNNNNSLSISQTSILEKVKQEKKIRVGYAIYAPYIDKNLETGELSGYSVDIIKEIADQMNVEIDWVETTWQIYILDLKSGKFDILLGPLFLTIPRAMEIDYSNSVGYFSGVAALVKEGDDRFSEIDDLNIKGLTISVPQGWVADEYARKYLTDATIKQFKGEGAALVISDMVTGNSDVALVDGPTAQQYLEKNPNQNVKGLFLTDPPVVVSAGFAFQKGDPEWVGFINYTLEVLRTGGILKNIAKKYNLYSFELDNLY